MHALQTFNFQYINASSGTFNGQATNFFQTIVPNGGAVAVGYIVQASCLIFQLASCDRL